MSENQEGYGFDTRQIYIEIDIHDTSKVTEEQSKVEIRLIENLHNFAKEVLKDLNGSYDETELEWESRRLASYYGELLPEEIFTLKYRKAEIASFTKTTEINKLIYTPSISLGFLELLRQKGVKSLDNLLDSI